MNSEPSLHPRRERGAALFIALMLLVVISILGVSAAQVTALQERMASNYRIDNVAFQDAEDLLRQRELEITRNIAVDRNPDTCRPASTTPGSAGDVDPTPGWASGLTRPTASTAEFQSLQDFRGAGRSTGLMDASEGTMGGIEAGSWRCLMFRVASIAMDEGATTVLQSTYIAE